MILTTTARRASIWRIARFVALLPLAAVLGHAMIYAARFGVGPGFEAAMTRGNHDSWWTFVATVVMVIAALVLTRELARVTRLGRLVARRPRRRRDPSRTTSDRFGYLREWTTLWAILLPAVAAIFAAQEELEHRAMGVAGHGLSVLFGPEHPLALPILALVSGAVAAIAALLRWRVRVLEQRLALRAPAHRRRRPLVDARPASSWWGLVARRPTGVLGLAHDAGRAPPSFAT